MNFASRALLSFNPSVITPIEGILTDQIRSESWGFYFLPFGSRHISLTD